MFVQIHILQSMPPGNLNRDETGQPKKCTFGGVTRGRISSQCLKRNIRLSPQFRQAFGDALADRTTYLPRMVAEELKANPKKYGIPAEDLNDLMLAIASKFKKEKRDSDSEEEPVAANEGDTSAASTSGDNEAGQTGQLVFFPKPFAQKIAELVAALRKDNEPVYSQFIGRKRKAGKAKKEDEKALKAEVDQFIKQVFHASKTLTVDIGLFGRMTTSDLVVNVEAACQVAHAISTHEVMIESDYFTAMDDRKGDFSATQTDKAGAAFLGSGENETFFNAAVYYKYLNVDLDALRTHLPSLSDQEAAQVAGVLVSAAALATPTGKQNSFASHSVPELILVELSKAKRPLSYANAFLQPVEGPNLLGQSATALQKYADSVGAAFAPADVHRILLAVGHAKAAFAAKHTLVRTFDDLVTTVVQKAQGAA